MKFSNKIPTKEGWYLLRVKEVASFNPRRLRVGQVFPGKFNLYSKTWSLNPVNSTTPYKKLSMLSGLKATMGTAQDALLRQNGIQLEVSEQTIEEIATGTTTPAAESKPHNKKEKAKPRLDILF